MCFVCETREIIDIENCDRVKIMRLLHKSIWFARETVAKSWAERQCGNVDDKHKKKKKEQHDTLKEREPLIKYNNQNETIRSKIEHSKVKEERSNKDRVQCEQKE